MSTPPLPTNSHDATDSTAARLLAEGLIAARAAALAGAHISALARWAPCGSPRPNGTPRRLEALRTGGGGWRTSRAGLARFLAS